MKPGLQFLYEVEANDRGAMDADELFRIELRFETTDRFSQQVRLARAVDRNVITLRFNPIDFSRLQKIDAAARLDYQSLQIFVAGFHLLEQGEDALVRAAVAVALHLSFGALPGNVEPFLIERLQQVIKCLDFKRAHCVFVISSYKDDVRKFLFSQRREDFEAADFRHLHIEED